MIAIDTSIEVVRKQAFILHRIIINYYEIILLFNTTLNY